MEKERIKRGNTKAKGKCDRKREKRTCLLKFGAVEKVDEQYLHACIVGGACTLFW